jgi:hypothetical protein
MRWGAQTAVGVVLSVFAVGLGWALLMAGPHNPEQGSRNFGKTPLEREQFEIDRDPSTQMPRSVRFSIASGQAFVLYSQYDSAAPRPLDDGIAYVRGQMVKLVEASRIPGAATKRILVQGHADVRRLEANVDAEGVCRSPNPIGQWYKLASPSGLAPTSNACLSLTRAYRVAAALAGTGAYDEGELLEIGYDPSPFMEGTNKLVDGNLYRFLQMPRKNAEAFSISKLRDELDVPAGFTHDSNDGYSRIRAKLQTNPTRYAAELLPFRSVVVLIQECETQNCPSKWAAGNASR